MNVKITHTWINTLIIVIGAILSYFLISQHKAKLDQANTTLTETKSQLANIELEVKYIKEELNIAEKRLKLSSGIMDLITNIIPSPKIDEDVVVWVEDTKTITFCAKLSNSGKFPFTIYDIKFSCPNDIEFEMQILPPLNAIKKDKLLLPGYNIKYFIDIKFIDSIPELNDNMSIVYKIRILDSIKDIALEQLKDVIREEEINKLIRISLPYSLKFKEIKNNPNFSP